MTNTKTPVEELQAKLFALLKIVSDGRNADCQVAQENLEKIKTELITLTAPMCRWCGAQGDRLVKRSASFFHLSYRCAHCMAEFTIVKEESRS